MITSKKTCKSPNCSRVMRYGVLGLCTGHYQRSRKGLETDSPLAKRELHRQSYTKTYRSWEAMCTRCVSKTAREYPQYGGRGIKVCDEWLHSYTNFLADMGERPENTSIDRIDNNGDYTPENCRWADKATQQQNQNISTRNKTGVKGVSWAKRLQKYTVSIQTRGVVVFLGNYESLIDATKARQKAELKYRRTA